MFGYCEKIANCATFTIPQLCQNIRLSPVVHPRKLSLFRNLEVLLCLEVQAGLLLLAVPAAEEVSVPGDDAPSVAQEEDLLSEAAAVRVEGDGGEGAAVHLQLEGAAVVGADLPDPVDLVRRLAERPDDAVCPEIENKDVSDWVKWAMRVTGCYRYVAM